MSYFNPNTTSSTEYLSPLFESPFFVVFGCGDIFPLHHLDRPHFANNVVISKAKMSHAAGGSNQNSNNIMRDDGEDDNEDMEMDDVVSDVEIDDDDDDDDDDGMHDVIDPPTSSLPEPVEEDAALVRRRAIQAIMRDTSLSEADKRMQIQNLMSGGRTSVAAPSAPLLPHQRQGMDAAAVGSSGNSSDAAGASTMDTNTACVHYERNCNIIAPCCQRIYGCRICHDELSEHTHPDMNRFMVREVVCKNCHTQQPVSNQCIQCHTVFGEYHCGICNLWMSMV